MQLWDHPSSSSSRGSSSSSSQSSPSGVAVANGAEKLLFPTEWQHALDVKTATAAAGGGLGSPGPQHQLLEDSSEFRLDKRSRQKSSGMQKRTSTVEKDYELNLDCYPDSFDDKNHIGPLDNFIRPISQNSSTVEGAAVAVGGNSSLTIGAFAATTTTTPTSTYNQQSSSAHLLSSRI